MKIEFREIGIKLKAENKEEDKILERFWRGGVGSIFRGINKIDFCFGDLVDKPGLPTPPPRLRSKK